MQHGKKSTPLIFKILFPMIILAFLQIIILLVVLALSGGLSYIKSYSYNMVSEKTENRKNYVETMFNQKTSLVYETANEVTAVTEQILEQQDTKIAAVETDKALNKSILEACSQSLISLIRRDMVNDAFIILNTGTLYDEKDRRLRPGIYLRDTDITENSTSDNNDIFMEMGSSEVARSYGLPLDYGWSLYIDVTDTEQCDFYYAPINTYSNYTKTPLYNLGYWSTLKRIAASQQESIKYTLPLVIDGTVYGVIGIGILEKTVHQSMPANDFSNSNACYILATNLNGSGVYRHVLHRGASYMRFIKDDTVPISTKNIGYNLYDFTTKEGTKCIGSIQRMNLYYSGSPYRNQDWAIISIADKDKVLSIYNALIKTVVISLLVTLVICVFISTIISQRINLPVAKMINALNAGREDNHLVEFNSSGIAEIDLLAVSIVDLQKQVAKMKDDEYTAKLIEANTALRDAYNAAKNANHAKTDFLSRMSHDIRTPMNAIIGMTTIAKSHLNNPDKLADCLEKISVSSRFLLALINEVLDMSKIEAGKFVLAQEEVNIRKLIDDLLIMVKPMIKEKNHELNVQIQDVVHENVICDSLRIQQVFMNIMSNAIKYTPAGGHILFSLSEKPTGQTKVGCYELIFIDDGNGMTPEFLEKVFAPFERAEDERVNKEQGTGLGMAITHNIVKMMDGDIQVESTFGKGSKFTVTIFLKLSDTEVAIIEEQQKNDSLQNIEEKDFSGYRVLLVDDNELNREIASEIMEMAGLEVEMAEHGREAVDKFAASASGYYDIIFMDVQMPVLNGYEASREIRTLTHPDAQSVPIIAMTANAFAEDVQEARKAGMNEHIAKPLDVNKLFMSLTRWITK